MRRPEADELSIVHVDMDAFYASVEILRHPELRGKPVVVGGSGSRGVVAAASYEARAFGIHSAMPSLRARRLCPHAVFLAGDHAHYAEVSARIMATFAEMTPLVEPLSLDEAFLDVSGARRLHGPAEQIARRIRTLVEEREGLGCSVGVARVKFLAKLASEAAKPRAREGGPRPGPGVVVVDPGREREFLHPMLVQALWGVGPATLSRLHRLGIRTIGQLAETPRAALIASLGRAQGAHLHSLANCDDPRPVVADQPVKSISHEETFARDLTDRVELEVELLRMADAVATRLRAASTAGRTVSLKVRFGDFRSVTRSSTLAEPVDSAHEIAAVGRRLFVEIDPAPGVRLLGIGVSQLGRSTARQLSLDDLMGCDGDRAQRSRAEAAVDEVRARFGAGAVGPASLIGPDGLRIARRGAQQWGPSQSSAPDLDAGADASS